MNDPVMNDLHNHLLDVDRAETLADAIEAEVDTRTDAIFNDPDALHEMLCDIDRNDPAYTQLRWLLVALTERAKSYRHGGQLGHTVRMMAKLYVAKDAAHAVAARIAQDACEAQAEALA